MRAEAHSHAEASRERAENAIREALDDQRRTPAALALIAGLADDDDVAEAILRTLVLAGAAMRHVPADPAVGIPTYTRMAPPDEQRIDAA